MIIDKEPKFAIRSIIKISYLNPKKATSIVIIEIKQKIMKFMRNFERFEGSLEHSGFNSINDGTFTIFQFLTNIRLD